MIEEKRALRALIRERRQSLPAHFRDQASQKICDALIALNAFSRAQSVGIYAAFGEEIDLRPVFNFLTDRGTEISLPSVRRTVPGELEMRYAAVTSWNDLRPGFRGILEPGIEHPTVAPELLVVPGLGFTPTGARIGYGGGTYDRYLAHRDTLPILIGVVFSSCLFPTLPEAEHDQRVHWVITEEEVLHCEREPEVL